MIVTIDGPAGAGKSSIAHQVADRLGYEFLDTGAMYRAVTYGALQNGLDLYNADALADYAATITIHWQGQRIFLDDADISQQIRNPVVTKSIRYLADVSRVRDHLTKQQRLIADGRDIVTEGRDQGTEVFPNADCKIFLTASPEERARRRQQQLADAGEEMSVDEILIAQNQRDLEDRMRDVGRLRAAPDAIVLQSDGLSADEVLQKILEIVDGCTQRQES